VSGGAVMRETEPRGALRALASMDTPGRRADTLRPRLPVFALIVALLALQVVARYRWGFLAEKDWQWAHILIGWGAIAAVLFVFHGRSARAVLTRRVLVVLATTLFGLLVFWYAGRSDSFRRFFPDFMADPGSILAIAPFIYFALNGFFWRLFVPFTAARFGLGLSPAALGLPLLPSQRQPSGLPRAAHRALPVIYLGLFLGVLPFVAMVADSPAFLAKYPLSRDMVTADGSIPLLHFITFEAFYFLIFLSGESFWRGFISFGLEKDLGLYGLLVMLVPYVTSHFGKPFSETLGAIAAGLVLGFLALKHRSVWLGVALHYGVALSMDLFAISHHGYTFR
jgi:membrane protease YdiL (CAAX protease family)